MLFNGFRGVTLTKEKKKEFKTYLLCCLGYKSSTDKRCYIVHMRGSRGGVCPDPPPLGK